MSHALHLSILDAGGPMAGRQMTLAQSPIRFGREITCDIVLDHPTVSRLHGQFDADANGQWTVTCFSENGLKVGRKVLANGQSMPVGPNTTLAINKLKLLTATPASALAPGIIPGSGHADAMPSQGQATQTPPSMAIGFGAEAPGQAELAAAEALKKRKLVWTGVAIWVGFLLVVGIVLASVTESSKPTNGLPPKLSAADIESEINTPPLPGSANPTQVQVNLAEANQQFESIDRQPGALAKAHWAYRKALTHTENGVFDNGLDQRRHLHAQAALTEAAIETYDDAYALIQSRQYQRALDELGDLSKLYPSQNNQSRLVQNMRLLANHCRKQR